MTSQTDKLFQKKLENFQQPAPAGAWERIESNLDKTSSKVIWLKVAAAVAFVAVATFMLWPTSHTTESNVAVSHKDSQQKTSAKTEKVEKVIPVPSTDLRNNPTRKSNRESNVTKATEKKIKSIQPTEKPNEQEQRKNYSENIPVEILSSENVASIETPSSANTVASSTIVYTAEEVNSKYLRKKSPAQATPDEKKSSGMQKLIGLAYALKNNENGLSDLRQKKDEILALNFLTEDKNNKEKN